MKITGSHSFCLITFILFLWVIPPAFGATGASTKFSETFATNCKNAVLNLDRTGVLSKDPEPLIAGKNLHYKINVFRSKTKSPDVQNIEVWIGSGDDTKLEIPRITDVCLDGGPAPTPTNNGDIIFTTAAGHSVPIMFHRNQLISQWKSANGKKTKVSDSIWLVECPQQSDGSCVEGTHAKRDDWPTCMAPIQKDDSVKTSSDGVDMMFSLCSKPKANETDSYYYELHFDQLGNKRFSVDVAIDPQIINRPN